MKAFHHWLATNAVGDAFSLIVLLLVLLIVVGLTSDFKDT